MGHPRLPPDEATGSIQQGIQLTTVATGNRIAGQGCQNIQIDFPGFTETQIQKILFDNPMAFYSQTPKFKPQLNLPYIDPATYQR